MGKEKTAGQKGAVKAKSELLREREAILRRKHRLELELIRVDYLLKEMENNQ